MAAAKIELLLAVSHQLVNGAEPSVCSAAGLGEEKGFEHGPSCG